MSWLPPLLWSLREKDWSIKEVTGGFETQLWKNFLGLFPAVAFFIQLFLPSFSWCLRSAPLWTWQEEEEEGGKPRGGRGGGLGGHWRQSQRGQGR